MDVILFLVILIVVGIFLVIVLSFVAFTIWKFFRKRDKEDETDSMKAPSLKDLDRMQTFDSSFEVPMSYRQVKTQFSEYEGKKVEPKVNNSFFNSMLNNIETCLVNIFSPHSSFSLDPSFSPILYVIVITLHFKGVKQQFSKPSKNLFGYKVFFLLKIIE